MTGAQERNRRLLEHLDPSEVTMLLDHIDRLTHKAEQRLAAERELG